jgi:quinol monooxygenase YgiN
MELLVATLAYTASGRDADVLARIRLITDTIRNAPGLINSRFYRSRGNNSYYLLLTTWEDEEGWHRAKERHNPKHLLLESAPEMLGASPEQWLMSYLWGYSRPSATPVVAAAHLASVRPDRVEFAQRGWIEGLRRPSVQTTLAFAFLARGMNEKSAVGSVPSPEDAAETGDAPYQRGNILLNLFNWGSEIEREDFYTDPGYQTISKFVNSVGVVRILPLEPL